MIDILLDSDMDILIENGDLVLGEVTEQNQKLLLLCAKGDVRADTTIGVGMLRYLKDDGDSEILGDIKREFERDGMKMNYISFDANDNLNLNAEYK